jgi:hypothetical protein
MLAEQEVTAWQQTDAAGAPDAIPPKFVPFGTSDSPSADVFAFYSNWGSFVTCKEFAWADKYNPAAAPNRQVFRRTGSGTFMFLLWRPAASSCSSHCDHAPWLHAQVLCWITICLKATHFCNALAHTYHAAILSMCAR